MTDAILPSKITGAEQLVQSPALYLSGVDSGMAIVRGTADKLAAALQSVGASYPDGDNRLAQTDKAIVIWQRPSRTLIMMPREAQQGVCEALSAVGVVAMGAGGQYCAYRLQGELAAPVINAGCSLDLRPSKFGPGDCAGTRIERLPVTLVKLADDDFLILVERPLGTHLHLWLKQVSSAFEKE